MPRLVHAAAAVALRVEHAKAKLQRGVRVEPSRAGEDGARSNLQLVRGLCRWVEHVEVGQEFREVDFVVLAGAVTSVHKHSRGGAMEGMYLVCVERRHAALAQRVTAQLRQQRELLHGNESFLVGIHRHEPLLHARDLFAVEMRALLDVVQLLRR